MESSCVCVVELRMGAEITWLCQISCVHVYMPQMPLPGLCTILYVTAHTCMIKLTLVFAFYEMVDRVSCILIVCWCHYAPPTETRARKTVMHTTCCQSHMRYNNDGYTSLILKCVKNGHIFRPNAHILACCTCASWSSKLYVYFYWPIHRNLQILYRMYYWDRRWWIKAYSQTLLSSFLVYILCATTNTKTFSNSLNYCFGILNNLTMKLTSSKRAWL